MTRRIRWSSCWRVGALGCTIALGSACAREQARPRNVVEPAQGANYVAAASKGATGLATVDEVDDRLATFVTGSRTRVPHDPEREPWMGGDVPTVVLVAFIDYQCPYSATLVRTLYEISRERPDDVRIVFRHHPLAFHAQAHAAAEAAVLAQRQGRFWPMHDRLFASQSALSATDLVVHAGVVGLSMPQFEAGLRDGAAAARVDEDLALAKELGVDATPVMFINGRRFDGALAREAIDAAIVEELAVATQLQERGAPRREVWARITRASSASPVAKKKPRGRGGLDPDASYAVGVLDRPVRGSSAALVTIISFTDFQCPFSKKVQATLRAIATTHPDVRFVARHNPLGFHPQARSAALAAVAAGRQGKFWEMHDALWEHQKELGPELYAKLAKELHLDRKRFRRDMDSADTARVVDEDVAEATRFASVATPTFFINGRVLPGAVPQERFDVLIDAERAKAQARRTESGSVGEELFESMRAGWLTQPEAPEPAVAGPLTADRAVPVVDNERHSVPIDGLPRKGAKVAKVEIVQCSEFDCPFCARVAPTLDELIAAHPDDVAVFFLHFPLQFHKGARPAARAAIAAERQGKFWPMHDKLFADRNLRGDTELAAVAADLGMNAKRFRKDLRDEGIDPRIDAETKRCTDLGVTGTPTFFINGRRLSGAQSREAFEAIIAEELRRGP